MEDGGAEMIMELFSCSGGMADGLRRAGLIIDMAFDADAEACDSYETNLGHRPVQLDARDLLRMARAGWSPGPIELFVADPPCTPWSRAGKRLGTADERDMLEVTVELVRLLRPRAYLIANVPGLDDGPNWPVVQRTIGSLASDGYCVVDFVRLDAADYGVPQHRVRPFWYGHRGGPCIEWPSKTHGPPGAGATLPGITQPPTPWVTCREALGHLSPKDLGKPVRLRWRGCKGRQIASAPDEPARVVGTSNLSDGNVLASPEAAFRKTHRPGHKPRASHIDEPAHVLTTRDSSGDGATLLLEGPNHRPSRLNAPARALTRNTHGDGALLVNEKHPINRPDEPSFTVTAKGDCRGAQGACVLEWPWDRPSTTVTARDGLAEPGHHVASNMSTANAIKLSERAVAILQGFPEQWVFAGKTKRARWSQIGQAMPPPLAEAVGRSIAAALRRTGAE